MSPLQDPPKHAINRLGLSDQRRRERSGLSRAASARWASKEDGVHLSRHQAHPVPQGLQAPDPGREEVFPAVSLGATGRWELGKPNGPAQSRTGCRSCWRHARGPRCGSAKARRTPRRSPRSVWSRPPTRRAPASGPRSSTSGSPASRAPTCSRTTMRPGASTRAWWRLALATCIPDVRVLTFP